MESNFYVQWHITNRCNLRCLHCYQDDFSIRNDLSLQGLMEVSENLLRTVGEWGRKVCIHLTGGEPLLKPELLPLLAALDRREAVEDLGIITNGLLLDPKWIQRLSAISKMKQIKISLDGPDAGSNDSLRAAGTFDRVAENISRLQKEERFEILLMFTLMKRNFRHLPSLIRLCRDWGLAGIIIERFIPWGQGRGIAHEVLEKREWQELLESLSRFFSIEREEENLSVYQAFQIDLRGAEPQLLGAPCVLGTDGLCLMPDGSVFPCRRLPLAIGNLLTEPLGEIWAHSELLNRLRKKESLKGKCGRCEIPGCRGCRSLSLALTGDFLAEDPHCGYVPL